MDRTAFPRLHAQITHMQATDALFPDDAERIMETAAELSPAGDPTGAFDVKAAELLADPASYNEDGHWNAVPWLRFYHSVRLENKETATRQAISEHLDELPDSERERYLLDELARLRVRNEEGMTTAFIQAIDENG